MVKEKVGLGIPFLHEPNNCCPNNRCYNLW